MGFPCVEFRSGSTGRLAVVRGLSAVDDRLIPEKRRL